MDDDLPGTSWPPNVPSRWSTTVPRELRAARMARAAIDRWMENEPAPVREDARSLATELVSNAVEHGRPPITLKLERKASHWLLEVTDGGAVSARGSTRFRRSGWADRIVDLLAESWGTGEDGSRVWCRIRATPIGIGDLPT